MFKTFSKRPTPWQAIKHIAVKLHNPQPVAGQAAPVRSLSDIYTSSLQSIVLGCHIAQRTARLVGVALLRTVVKHPLGWPLNQVSTCCSASSTTCIPGTRVSTHCLTAQRLLGATNSANMTHHGMLSRLQELLCMLMFGILQSRQVSKTFTSCD